MDIDKVIQMRIEAKKAQAHLEAILEYFSGNDAGYHEMDNRFREFFKWLWEESPIA